MFSPTNSNQFWGFTILKSKYSCPQMNPALGKYFVIEHIPSLTTDYASAGFIWGQLFLIFSMVKPKNRSVFGGENISHLS